MRVKVAAMVEVREEEGEEEMVVTWMFLLPLSCAPRHRLSSWSKLSRRGTGHLGPGRKLRRAPIGQRTERRADLSIFTISGGRTNQLGRWTC